MTNFHPLEVVVGRGSDTQLLQVGENWSSITSGGGGGGVKKLKEYIITPGIQQVGPLSGSGPAQNTAYGRYFLWDGDPSERQMDSNQWFTGDQMVIVSREIWGEPKSL